MPYKFESLAATHRSSLAERRQPSRTAARQAVLLLGSLLLAGCGPAPRGEVTGIVTLDDAPLPDALVSFVPQDEKLAGFASAVTDAEGRYSLMTDDDSGALLGKYTVRIATGSDGNSDTDPPIPSIPERVPVEYNVQSTLVVEVEPGSNVFDFPLVSGGEIVQPDE